MSNATQRYVRSVRTQSLYVWEARSSAVRGEYSTDVARASVDGRVLAEHHSRVADGRDG